MSKKAVKLGSFLQYSVHIFPRHDGCFKNKLKNFVEPYHEEVKHGQCDSIIFLKTFSLETSKWLLLNLSLEDSRILYF